MNKEHLVMNANPIVVALEKPSAEFTKADIIDYIVKNDIRMVNFMYPGGDGKLKTLNFVINDLAYLDTILTCGERVDGSSLFSDLAYLDTILTCGERVDGSSLFSFIQAGSSDLYVLPRFRTAFVDPFAEIPTVSMLCSFFDKDGCPLESSPEHTLHKAAEAFREVTGMEFQAMGELEYYVISDDEMQYIAQAGGQIKYGHSEVGNFCLDGKNYEQNEIEFLPVDVEQAADQLMIAKWVIRNLGYELGYDVTFAPKITTGKAGSGLHIHMRMIKDGKNQMLSGGVLSESARKMIAGMMDLACWGDRNRSVLVRVPLGWAADVDMCHAANPLEPKANYDTSIKQTVEMRSPDGSADLYQLLAGLCVACRHGFEMENALELAEKTYVNVNIHAAENADRLATLAQLPDSCVASADCLDRQRKVFEEHNVFSPAMIDGIIDQLRAYDDKMLRKNIENYPEEIQKLVTQYFHCG